MKCYHCGMTIERYNNDIWFPPYRHVLNNPIYGHSITCIGANFFGNRERYDEIIESPNYGYALGGEACYEQSCGSGRCEQYKDSWQEVLARDDSVIDIRKADMRNTKKRVCEDKIAYSKIQAAEKVFAMKRKYGGNSLDVHSYRCPYSKGAPHWHTGHGRRR